jgi:hypothetical protein
MPRMRGGHGGHRPESLGSPGGTGSGRGARHRFPAFHLRLTWTPATPAASGGASWLPPVSRLRAKCSGASTAGPAAALFSAITPQAHRHANALNPNERASLAAARHGNPGGGGARDCYVIAETTGAARRRPRGLCHVLGIQGRIWWVHKDSNLGPAD